MNIKPIYHVLFLLGFYRINLKFLIDNDVFKLQEDIIYIANPRNKWVSMPWHNVLFLVGHRVNTIKCYAWNVLTWAYVLFVSLTWILGTWLVEIAFRPIRYLEFRWL